MTVSLRHEVGACLAFVERYVYAVKRYFAWELVFLVYNCVNCLTIALIGVESNDPGKVMFLVLGAVLWGFLSIIFQEISDCIAWERWEGTLEYTFMAPIKRLTHVIGMCLGAVVYGTVRTLVILGVVAAFLHLSLARANLGAALLVLVVSSLSLMGLGLLVAVLPLLSHEKGVQATHIAQACMLLVSGVYYDISVLPTWLQPVSKIVPATYTLRAMRAAILDGATVAELAPTLGILVLMGLVLIPLGLTVFQWGERYARKTGLLSRSG